MHATNIKSIARRLSVLEVAFHLRPAPIDWRRWKSSRVQPLQLRFGELCRLPADYRGERHIEMVRRLPDKNGQQWAEFAEKPGPPPVQPPRDPRLPRILDVVFVKPLR
jgi:hypothetical protein